MRLLLFVLLIISTSVHGSLSDIIEKSLPTTVIVFAFPPQNNVSKIEELLSDNKRSMTTGTGFFINEYEIITNQHVIDKQGRFIIQRHGSTEDEEAELIGYDQFADVALLRVKTPNKNYLKWRKNEVRIGEDVFTIGHPFGYEYSVSKGIISNVERRDDEFGFVKVVQSDLAVNKGNSGGALIDTNGYVVGLIRALVTSNGGSDGISLAVKPLTVKESIERLRIQKVVTRPSIGIAVMQAVKGVIIIDIVKDGAADKAGLLVNDIILSVDHKPIININSVGDIVHRYYPGDMVPFDIIRNNKHITLEIRFEKIVY